MLDPSLDTIGLFGTEYVQLLVGKSWFSLPNGFSGKRFFRPRHFNVDGESAPRPRHKQAGDSLHTSVLVCPTVCVF